MDAETDYFLRHLYSFNQTKALLPKINPYVTGFRVVTWISIVVLCSFFFLIFTLTKLNDECQYRSIELAGNIYQFDVKDPCLRTKFADIRKLLTASREMYAVSKLQMIQ